jgi:hypothetical protein
MKSKFFAIIVIIASLCHIGIAQVYLSVVARIKADKYIAGTNETITFDASDSFTNDSSTINTYKWDTDWPEGTSHSFETGTDTKQTSYSREGLYRVALLVTTNTGLRDIAFFYILITDTPPDTIYVDKNATGSNDGSSWANAYNYIQDAIANSNHGDQIWVKGGTYSVVDDMCLSFTLDGLCNISIYGGFAGDEESIYEREPGHDTVLHSYGCWSGHGYIYSYRPIISIFDSANIIIDGFTIENNSPNAETSRYYGYYDFDGGGIVCQASRNVSITNCVIKDNVLRYGGGVALVMSEEISIVNCAFINNRAIIDGGGLCIDYSGPTEVVNCTFYNNEVGTSGDGTEIAFAVGSSFDLLNTIVYNRC